MILTAEANNLPTDANKLLRDYGLVGCHSNKSNGMSIHARINSSGYIRPFWESDVDDKTDLPQSLKSNLARRQKEPSGNRASDLLSNSLLIQSPLHALWKAATSVQLRTPFEPTASCIYDTRKGQLVSRSGLPRKRLLCMPSTPQAGIESSPAAVRDFFGTVLHQVNHFKVDVIAGDANAAAYKYCKKARAPRSAQSC